MENKIYKIYHIPTFIHKNGRIGKIGCTVQTVKKRVEDQGYTDFEILEEFTCIYLVSYREIALQKEYGYPVDTIPYYKVYEQRMKTQLTLEQRSKNGIKGGNINKKNKTGICGLTQEQRTEYGRLGAHSQSIEDKSKGGKIGGKLKKDKGKPVLMIDKITNEIIQEFPAVTTAARFLQKRENKILAVLHGEKYRYTAYGYKWKWKPTTVI
jgi:hypothetical protein